MSFPKLLPMALAFLTASIVSSPQVGAHNTAKYTGVPFAVAGSCPQVDPSVSSTFVTVNRQLQLRSVVNDDLGSGFEVYASVPGSGALPATAGTIPEGVLTFNISAVNRFCFLFYSI